MEGSKFAPHTHKQYRAPEKRMSAVTTYETSAAAAPESMPLNSCFLLINKNIINKKLFLLNMESTLIFASYH